MNASVRQYIKIGIDSLGTFGVSVDILSTKKWLRTMDTHSDSPEKIAYTYHPPDCGGCCSHKCTVREGRLVMIEPNEWADNRYSLICLKGLSEVEHVYSPDRLQTPLKRVGKRGEGEFLPISWDEAMTTIADTLKRLKNVYGGQSILFNSSFGVDHAMEFLPTLLGAQVGGGSGIDIGCANGLEETTGDANYGAMYNEITDWVNAKTIILIGVNILETTMTDAQFFFEAKDAGAKIISVDPAYSTTVAKSDEWIRIKPGTDGALLLAMISLVLENNWYQEDYLRENSSAPFLVRLDRRTLLRFADLGDEMPTETTEEAPKSEFLVWDKGSNSVQPHRKMGVLPQLEGEFEVQGIKVKTVFTLLKENQRLYSPSWATRITEIPEQSIRDLAEHYATEGPGVLGLGWGGPDKWGNADITGHAAAILASLTGNIGRKGGGVGCPLRHYVTWKPILGVWKLPSEFKKAKLEMPPTDMRYKPNSVRALINHGNSIQQHFANLPKTIKWLNQLELVVTIAPYDNTSVEYSDIVLPACTSYESEYEFNNLQITRGHVLLQQKVLDPLYQSKSDFRIEKELAAKLGLEQYLPRSREEYLKALLDSPDPMLKGITLETLQDHQGIMQLNAPQEPYIGHLDQVYDTLSGKLELYQEKMIEFNQALPNYEGPSEATAKSALAKKYPLQFSQAHTKNRVHSQFANSRWINELDPEPKLEMNPQDARSRGLREDDLVKVFNDRGSYKVRCKFTESLRPGVVRQYPGWWSKHMVDGNIQNVTNDRPHPRHYQRRYGPVIPYNDTLVEVKKA